jgi:predicted phage baseplate assembly protein
VTDHDVTADACGPPVGALTPAPIHNRPGLSALEYRVGSHATFKATMLTALSREPDLRGLTARDDADPAIALIDAWATVLDVLSFYQERIANEGYLATATERRSVYELSGAIGYRPDPGVAASVHLAFELETATGSPVEVTVPAGVAVQSVPGPEEHPQTFETIEAIIARGAWNALRAATSVPATPGEDDTRVRLEGLATGLRPGDGLLFVRGGRTTDGDGPAPIFRVVKAVVPDMSRGVTAVIWDGALPAPSAAAPDDVEVHVLRRRTALFGHNAPDWRGMPDELRKRFEVGFDRSPPGPDRTEWPGMTLSLVGTTPAAPNPPGTIHLDAAYPGIVTDSWIVLMAPDAVQTYLVGSTTEAARADFTLTARTSALTLAGAPAPQDEAFPIRQTVVHAESERLAVADAPLSEDVGPGETILLDGTVSGLERGRTVLVSGRASVDEAGPGPPGQDLVEVAVVHGLEPAGRHTVLRLVEPLRHTYERASVVVRANVAPATHGAAQAEVLGSGDASQRFQRFPLAKAPLTHLPDPLTGSASTLQVRVSGVAWREVAGLHGHGPRDRVYTVDVDADANATVRFGDGATGARPATGEENITAAYRVGVGREGHVDAGRLSLLMTRGLGLRSVTNPQPATGGADPESRDEARDNAPRTVLTFDRVVSLRDHELLARSFPGLAKAQATPLWDGEVQIVHLSVAGIDGLPVEPGSAIQRNLLATLHAAGDPHRPLVVQTCETKTFDLAAGVFVQAHHDTDAVLAQVTAALRGAFSFARRDLGRAVDRSEVVAAIQAVEGVRAVDLRALHLTGEPRDEAPVLLASSARRSDDGFLPAQLLTLNPEAAGLDLEARG